MIITIPESGFIPLDYFKYLLDISRISFYTVKHKDGALIIKFYDKNHKLLKLKGFDNDKEKEGRKEGRKEVAKGRKKA